MNDPSLDELNQVRNPVRKPNRLKNYDYNTSGMYFITICTKEKRKLLGVVIDGTEGEPPVVRLTKMGIIVEQQIQSISG